MLNTELPAETAQFLSGQQYSLLERMSRKRIKAPGFSIKATNF